MKKLIASLVLGLSLLTTGEVLAQAPAAVASATAATVTAPAAAQAPVPPISAAAAVAAPVPNKGDTTWMMVATLLVILMTIPGLALFYGGLVRSKNMLSVLMQVMVTFSMIVVL